MPPGQDGYISKHLSALLFFLPHPYASPTPRPTSSFDGGPKDQQHRSQHTYIAAGLELDTDRQTTQRCHRAVAADLTMTRAQVHRAVTSALPVARAQGDRTVAAGRPMTHAQGGRTVAIGLPMIRAQGHRAGPCTRLLVASVLGGLASPNHRDRALFLTVMCALQPPDSSNALIAHRPRETTYLHQTFL